MSYTVTQYRKIGRFEDPLIFHSLGVLHMLTDLTGAFDRNTYAAVQGLLVPISGGIQSRYRHQVTG